ncbi:MAG TPA: hypothetical protein VMT30_05785 [Candidatus Saccharimonadia bacterium]|nr:hypothetical protein [Candidatus Saccharimonadia bacterium]
MNAGSTRKGTLPGLGLAVCGRDWDVVFHDGRTHSGVVQPGEDTIALVKRVADLLGTTARVIGVSHHDFETIRSMPSPDGLSIVPVSPTLATLAGVSARGQAELYRQTLVAATKTANPGPTALLKIGPRNVTWASDEDAAPTEVGIADVIHAVSPLAGVYAQFLLENGQHRSVELLGNPGWVNGARFFAARDWEVPERTRDLLAQAVDQSTVRVFVSHLGVMARNGDPFAGEVARFMTQPFAAAVGQVAAATEARHLYVQWNAVSAVPRMPGWMCNPAGGGLAPLFRNGRNSIPAVPASTNVTLLGPRPQLAEARGAYDLAARQVSVSA